MESSDAREWLEDHLEQDFSVEKREDGTSNINFFVEGEDEYVLRISQEVSTDRLGNEYQVLKFLEEKGIDFVPRAVDSDVQNSNFILLETKVGEKRLEEDFENHLEDLAEKVAEIHSIPASTYGEFTGQKEEDVSDLRKVFRRDFREWSEKPFKKYLREAEEPSERLRECFERQKDLVKSVSEVEVRRSLVHGDLGGNFRISGDEVFLVDWELARAGYPGIELLYMFQRKDMDRKEKSIFLEEYRKYRDLGKEFEEARELYPRILAFNDTVWAAKRVVKGDTAKKQLFRERLDSLEEIQGC